MTFNALRPVAAVCLLLSPGCQTPQRWLSEEELLGRQQTYLDAYQSELDVLSSQSTARIESEYRRALESPENEPQSLDVLILSGGGAFGAFGAGFLEGWGLVAEPELQRPIFDSVSGVSTGALIAPFAFIGTPEAYAEIVELYENPGRDWVRKRGLIPYLPGNVSLYDVSNLHERIESVITPGLIGAIAEEGDRGRQLIIGTTNLDFGLMRVWDLARLALENPREEAVERAVSILLASSAIPGAFPPVLIDGLLYVDGGATMQVVGGTEQRTWAYSPDARPFALPESAPPIQIRVWMIVNQKLVPDPKVTKSRWTSVAARSLGTIIRTSTLQSIQDAETYTRLIDQRPDFDAQFRYVAVPQDFPIPDSDEMFDAGTMRQLTALGRKMGADPSVWRTEALRPGAPFELEAEAD